MSFFLDFHPTNFLHFSASIYLAITDEDYDMNLFVAIKMIIENIVNFNFIKLRPYRYFDFSDFVKEVAKNLKLNYGLNQIDFENLDC
jgi:hypothetical protein